MDKHDETIIWSKLFVPSMPFAFPFSVPRVPLFSVQPIIVPSHRVTNMTTNLWEESVFNHTVELYHIMVDDFQ